MNKLALHAACSAATLCMTQGQVILNTSFDDPEFTDGLLQGQNDWLGQNLAIIDTSGDGFTSSIGGTFDRNLFGNGARGGVAGTPVGSGSFKQFETLKITFEYQFTLSSDTNTFLCNVGITEALPADGLPPVSQGFQGSYNIFDLVDENDVLTELENDGNVRFFSDLQDPISPKSIFMQGYDAGLDPNGTRPGATGPDLESDPLLIEYILEYTTGDGSESKFRLASFSVKNQTTGRVFNYGGTGVIFDWVNAGTTDPATDAFFIQQLAINNQSEFTGRANSASLEYIAAPAERNAIDISFTGEEGYIDGDLQFQQGWLGQASPQVDTSETGSVSSSMFFRNLLGQGIRGGGGGIPTDSGNFIVGESIRLTTDYQFILDASGNRDLGFIGFAPTGPNADNGFNANPSQGFKASYSVVNVDVTGGSLRVFPDLTDLDDDLTDTMLIDGLAVGVNPTGIDENGIAGTVEPDLESDLLRFTYVTRVDADNLFTVTEMSVTNLATSETFTYAGNPVSFFWQEEVLDGDPIAYRDAFYAQNLSRSAATGIMDAIKVDFIAAPPSTDPEPIVTIATADDGNFTMVFRGTPGASYILTQSEDLETAFTDTGESPVVADATTGIAAFTVSVDTKNFFRVEEVR